MRMSVCDLAKLHWGLHQGCCIFSASSNSNQSIVFALFHLAIVFVTTNLLRLECLSPNQSCFSVCSVYILKISHHKHRFPTGVIVYLHWMAIRWVLHSQNCPIMFGCTDTVTPPTHDSQHLPMGQMVQYLNGAMNRQITCHPIISVDSYVMLC